MNHPNVLRCFGVTPNPLQTVTEWAPNGHVIEYLQEHHGADRIRLVSCYLSGGVIFIRWSSSALVDRHSPRAGIPPFVWGDTRELEAGWSIP